MEMLAYSEENRSVVIPWVLDPDHEDLDLEVDGCGCGCGDGGCGSCGCSCACSCSCSCACDDTGANGDDSDDFGASDSGGGDESSAALSCLASVSSSTLGMDPVAQMTGQNYNPNVDEHFITTGARGLGDMMSPPVDVAGVVATIGTALGDPDCQTTIANTLETVTDAASEAGRQLGEADKSIQNAVDSIRASLHD